MNNIYLENMISSFNNSNWQSCIEFALHIIKLDKSNMQAWLLCSLSYEKLNDRVNAIICIKEALKNDKKLNNGINKYNLSVNLAEFYRRDNQVLLAIAILKSFLPNDYKDFLLDENYKNKDILDSTLFFNLAKCYADLQDYENSIEFYKIAIKINPKDLGALFNLANSELAIGSRKNALKYYSLAYDGGYLDAGINLAQIYVSFDDLENARKIYLDLKDKYFYDCNFCFNYANFLRFSLNFKRAKDFYIQAFNISQDARFAINLSYLLLSMGDFNEGFLFYEYRKAFLQDVQNHFLKISSNKEIIFNSLENKNIIFFHEQGFGDSIMFARFIPKFLKILESKGIEYSIFLDIPNELKGIFKCFNIDFLDSKDNMKKDIYIPLPSLPYLCDINEQSLKKYLFTFREKLLKTLSLKIHKNFNDFNILNYLKKKVHSTIKLKNSMLKIGLNFSSNMYFDKAKEKSIYPIYLLEKLPQGKNYQYFSLQYEGLDSELAARFGIKDLSSEIKDFEDSARMIANCDLIITIDSALAHLSASLGVPTVLLLYKRYDWRWGELGRVEGSCEWYDKLYFLAQEKLNDWSFVLDRLHKILK